MLFPELGLLLGGAVNDLDVNCPVLLCCLVPSGVKLALLGLALVPVRLEITSSVA